MSTQDNERREELRALVRAMFRDPEEEPPPTPKPDNHIPREGSNPTAEPSDMRYYTRALFARALSE